MSKVAISKSDDGVVKSIREGGSIKVIIALHERVEILQFLKNNNFCKQVSKFHYYIISGNNVSE